MRVSASTVLGFLMLALGGFLTVYEIMHPPVINSHLYLFVGLAVLGALAVSPDHIVEGVRGAVVPVLVVVFRVKQAVPPAENNTPPEPSDKE